MLLCRLLQSVVSQGVVYPVDEKQGDAEMLELL